jgi:1-acyl-sn-glycerol-3-phosphate acyltransferase
LASELPTRTYVWTRRLARRLLASHYARLEVDGVERIPLEGPAILVANHGNSLVDSLALLCASPRPTAPLAKAPLFQSRLLRPWLEGVGAVPVFREQDVQENAGRGVRANLGTFDACRARLQAGGALVLFPEGVSQPQPRLLPLRTGVARIALDAGRPVTVVPVGLVYEPPGERRGRALVVVGDPFVADGSRLEKSERRSAISALTRRIEEALRELLSEADSQHDLALLRLLAQARAQEAGLSADVSLAEAHRRTQVLSRGLSRLRAVDPAAVEDLRWRADAFQRALGLVGVPLALLERRTSGAGVLRFLLATLLPALVLVPLAVVAALATWPGRVLGDLLVLRQIGASEDVRVFARTGGWALGNAALGLVAALAAASIAGTPWALLLLPALLLLLGVHVLFRDAQAHLRERVRAFLLLAGTSRVRQDLRAQRSALARAVEAAASRLAVPP